LAIYTLTYIPSMAENRDGVRCPVFSGEKEEDGQWRRIIDDWILLHGGGEYLGVEIRSSLRGRASEVAYEMSTEQLEGENGAKALLDRLDRVDKNERVTDCLIRYERAAEENRVWKNSNLSDELKGYPSSQNKRSSEPEQSFTGCVLGGKDTWDDLMTTLDTGCGSSLCGEL
jgi:hypothetical protein